jgi:hypothetical protein
MNKQFSAGWVISILALIIYFFVGVLLAAEAITIGVLLIVLVVWLLLYKSRYKSLGALELIVRMYADFKRTIERIKERVAEDEASRRVAGSRRRQALTEWESRSAGRPNEAPTADKKYAEMIESRVREKEANQEQSEGTNETES